MNPWLVGCIAAVIVATGAFYTAANGPDHGWDPGAFAYERANPLVVEESTPTAAQLAFLPRPPQEPDNAPPPSATAAAAPATIGHMNILRLRFVGADGETVPALLCTPRNRKGPFRLAIAIHGLTSHKAQVCGQVGPALTDRGFAVLAMDLPCHGERRGNPFDFFNKGRPFANGHRAVVNVRQLIDLAEKRPEIDVKAGVVLVGYSLGTWVSALAGPADDRVQALVLMVGGVMDVATTQPAERRMSAIDPRVALPHFAPRPVLMQNGKWDLIVKPELARRLFAAAAEPKQQLWYNSGHLLPAEASKAAAAWAQEKLENPGGR